MKIGKIVELIQSDDGEILQVIVSTAKSTGTFLTFKLRYLEGYWEDLEWDERDLLPSDKEIHPLDPQTSQDTDKNPIRIRAPREAKKKASAKI